MSLVLYRMITGVILDQVLQRDGDIIQADVGPDDLVMLSVERGRYFSLSGVGLAVWELLEQPRTISDLCASLCAEFEVDELTCQADVMKFVTEMKDNGLIHVADA